MEKVVLITGAGGGLGQALVKDLLEEKYLVIGTGRNFNNKIVCAASCLCKLN